MLYRIILCFIEARYSSPLKGNESNYVLWKARQKKNESDVLKKYTPKTGKQKNHSIQKERRD